VTKAQGWTLRAATPGDARAVSALLGRSYTDDWARHYEPALVAALRPRLVRANPGLLASGTYYLAVTDDGLPVGCGGWSREAAHTGDIEAGVAHIRHFATDASWIRRGIASMMLTRCIAEVGGEGVTTLFADSARGAAAFYERFGFENMGPSAPTMGGHVLPGFTMRLAL